MPQTPFIKRFGLTAIVIACLFILILLALIWQGTANMNWRTTPVMQALRGDVDATVGMMAPIAPPFFENAKDFYPVPNGATAEDRVAVGERVIRTSSLSIRVDDTEKRLAETRAIATAEGGFVAHANIIERDGVKSAELSIRVPQQAFERTLSKLKDLASTVFDETTNAEDVTAQFVDIEARLKAARAEEVQYLQILKQAGSIEETLQVTARLGEVRARIESMDAQMRYLRDRTEYATIDVSMTEEVRVHAPTPTWKPNETFNLSLRELVIALQGLADALISFGVFLIGLILPVALVIGFVIWIVRAIWKKYARASS